MVDNSDNFMTSTLQGTFTELVAALNQPVIEPLLVQQISLDIVELYP